ncbi:hypothetical protein [Acidimangrovimonas pyrenivorans]|uniref:Uncharacterized protein n=1 Tax=Acidimangrovimonas pyrenivorans TaxID=2030798 RepID=A0ABV7ACS3_9RHOB
MRKIPVIDDDERDRIRDRLKDYQERHGIGAPRLQERMSYALDRTDQSYIDVRSLQRFLRNEVRTEDEKVLRYRKFLSVEARGENEPDFVTLVRTMIERSAQSGAPFFHTPEFEANRLPEADNEIAPYQGRYSVWSQSYCRDRDADNLQSENHIFFILLPSSYGPYLKVHGQIVGVDEESLSESASWENLKISKPYNQSLMMLIAPKAFLFVTFESGRASFAILHDVTETRGNGRTTLEGPMIEEENVIGGDPVSFLRLTRVEGPVSADDRP